MSSAGVGSFTWFEDIERLEINKVRENIWRSEVKKREKHQKKKKKKENKTGRM